MVNSLIRLWRNKAYPDQKEDKDLDSEDAYQTTPNFEDFVILKLKHKE